MPAALRYYSLILCLAQSVVCQGSVQLTFSNNPVYSGQEVTLTFSFQSGLQLLKLTIDAFNGSLKQGSLFYQSNPNIFTAVGVFANRSLNGYPNIPWAASSVNVTLTATPSYELDYNCTALVFDSSTSSLLTLTCTPGLLRVNILPSPPIIAPNATTFNQSDNATITCVSLYGKPAADISLTAILLNGSTIASRGISFSSLVLTSPSMDWHNATATCTVLNHNFPNMTVTRRVMIIHVRSTGVPSIIPTSLNTVTLDCSAYVRSYPGVLYSWQASIGTNATVGSYPSNATFDVQPGHWGSFNCTATNIVTMDNVTITFIVSNVTFTTSSYVSPTNDPSNNNLWVIGLVLGIATIVVIAIVLGVLCKRGHFSKGRIKTWHDRLAFKIRIKKHDVKSTTIDQRSDKAYNRDIRVTERSNAATCAVDLEYDSLDAQRSSEPTYAQLIAEQNSNSITLYENFKSSKPSFEHS